MSKRPINSIKHIIDVSGNLVGGSESAIPLADAVDAADLLQPTQVNTGCTISSLFVSVFILGESATVSGLADWYFWKIPNNAIAAGSVPTPGNTGVARAKKFIFHEEKGIFATEDGTPMVFKGVIKLPPRFRRMGTFDRLEIRLLSPVAAQFCIKAIYKEYR